MISRLLPGKENLAIAQAAARPKSELTGTAIAATSRVSSIAATRVGVGERLRESAKALLQRLREHDAERREQEQRQEDDGDERSAPARVAGVSVAHDLHAISPASPQTWPNLRRLQAWMRLIASSATNEIASMIVAMPVAPA